MRVPGPPWDGGGFECALSISGYSRSKKEPFPSRVRGSLPLSVGWLGLARDLSEDSVSSSRDDCSPFKRRRTRREM